MATKFVFFNMTAAALTANWTADEDYELIGAHSTSVSNICFLSTDPDQLSGDPLGATAGEVKSLLWFQGQIQRSVSPPMKIPVLKGTKIYLAAAGAMGIMFWLDQLKTSPD